MALEILKPTDYTFSGGGTNDNPGNAYDVDVSSYNRLGVSNNNADPTIVYHTWQSAQYEHKTRQLFLKRRGIGNSNDNWDIYYSTDGGNNWNPIETGLINPELGSTTAVSIDTGLDLANLQIKIATHKVAGPDNGYADIYDVWLEGLHHSWVHPTSTNDPWGAWTDDDDAIDGDTGTYATNTQGNQGKELEFLHAALDCDKVRIWGVTAPGDPGITVDVYYSAGWHNIHSGAFTEAEYYEISIGSTESVTKARAESNGETNFYICEFDFWEVEAPPTFKPQVIGPF